MTGDGRATSVSTRRLLARIAQTLGIPVAALSRAHDADVAGAYDSADLAAEAVELIRLFTRIEDQQTRRRCLAFVRAAAINYE